MIKLVFMHPFRLILCFVSVSSSVGFLFPWSFLNKDYCFTYHTKLKVKIYLIQLVLPILFIVWFNLIIDSDMANWWHISIWIHETWFSQIPKLVKGSSDEFIDANIQLALAVVRKLQERKETRACIVSIILFWFVCM